MQKQKPLTWQQMAWQLPRQLHKEKEWWGGRRRGGGRMRCLWSLLELVSNCRQLVIPLALSAFKFILLSHLQVIPRREMNIISMSVYFVFGTRRKHKNKRQICPPMQMTPHWPTPPPPLPPRTLPNPESRSTWMENQWKLSSSSYEMRQLFTWCQNTQLIKQLSSWFSYDWGNNNLAV